MRSRPTLVMMIAVAAAVLPATLAAQSLKNERRHHAWVQSLETELLRHCLELPEKRRAKIADLLAAGTGNDPLSDLGQTLAIATGEEADIELLFRRGLMLFAMPEVVDPVGAPDDKRVPHIDAVSITVWAPRTMTLPGKVRFALRIKDAAGKTVWTGEIRKDTGLYELRTFLTHVKVPVKDLPDGLYEAEADIILDDKEPRPKDPRLRAAFWVLRGFVKRRLDLLAGVRGFHQKLAPLPWALLSGSDRVVHRFFSGEPAANTGACLRELTHGEHVLKNAGNDKPLLQGVSGWVTLEFPNKEMWQVQVALRLMPDKQKGPPPPLVLFVPGAPAWNPRGRRPRSPESLAPGFLVEMLKTSGFDHERRWQLAVVESPGRVRNTLATLHNVLAALEKLEDLGKAVRFDRRKVFLVGDRQGASGVVSLALHKPQNYRGLVIANGGTSAVTLNNIEKLGNLPVLVIPGHGHVASESVLQHYEIARKHKQAGHIQVLSRRRWPWSIALPLASREIETFIAGVLGEPLPESRPTTRPESRPASRPESRPTSRPSR